MDDSTLHLVSLAATGALFVVGILIKNAMAKSALSQEKMLGGIAATQAKDKAELIAHQSTVQATLTESDAKIAQGLAIHETRDDGKFESIEGHLDRHDGHLARQDEHLQKIEGLTVEIKQALATRRKVRGT